MYLKRIELHGFKSFADLSVIEFQPGITGIVGPNGCGKSNISDAVRWVLGEQSVKSLRGTSMSDVIFNGSEDRKPQNLAEVTLVFDNSERYVDIDYEEVQITRRLYRQDNEAEYLINKEPCRLKDIVDLMMDTGLGKGSLSIISQGNISSFADSKPEDRRGMFEEAAGVSKYKKRKTESLRKLERTQNNLERAEDICTELERQITPLKKQKEKAETYLALREELESIEVNVLVRQIDQLSKELKKINQDIERYNLEKATIDNEILLNDQQNEALKKRMFELDNEVNHLQSQLFNAMNKVTEIEKRQVEIATKRQSLLESNDEADLANKINALKEIIREYVVEYNDQVDHYKQLKAEMEELNSSSKDKNNLLDGLRTRVEALNLSIHETRNEKQRLEDVIHNKSNYSYGVQSILKNMNALNGIVGVFGELLDVDEKYESALSVAMGNAANFIITKTNEDARDAIKFLKFNHSGRATFLPIDTMRPRGVREDHQNVCDNFKGYLGHMSDFISYDKNIAPIILNQLDNILLTETLEQATELSRMTYARYKIVTLDGEEIHVGGSLTGGSKTKNHSSFNNKKLLERLIVNLSEKEKDLIKLKGQIVELENETREISHVLLQKQMSFAKLELTMTNKHKDIQDVKGEYEALTKEKLEINEIENNDDTKLIESLNEAKAFRDSITEQIQTKRQLRMDLVNESTEIENILKHARTRLREINDANSLLVFDKAKNETTLNNHLNRLNEEYKMTFEYAYENFNNEIDDEKSMEEVRLLRHRIENLGHVNVDSIQEYEEVSTRYETLNKQRLDLVAARDTILEAISEMDEIMTDKFSSTFEKINIEFNHVFRELFGGGRALLKYTDPDNILETGIDIDVVPPGKAKQNISLFSGGEKALIAISCLFAILRVRPVPMCILDEVEAALDVANVERYARFLRQFSKTTQFIVVTHREGTMAECDLLYGATMQQKGVTKLVSVKLKDAIDLADNQ